MITCNIAGLELSSGDIKGNAVAFPGVVIGGRAKHEFMAWEGSLRLGDGYLFIGN